MEITKPIMLDETGKEIVNALTFKYQDGIAAVKAEAEAQKEEIDAKGLEIKNSLPADYLTLVDKVDSKADGFICNGNQLQLKSGEILVGNPITLPAGVSDIAIDENNTIYLLSDSNEKIGSGVILPKQNTAEILNNLPINGDELTDYYVLNENNVYIHYRYIDGNFKQIGSDSYTRDEIDQKLQDLNNSETIQEIKKKALGNAVWDEGTRTIRFVNLESEQVGEPITITGGESAEYDFTYDSETGAFVLMENGEAKSSAVILGGGGSGGGSNITIDMITPASIVSLDGEQTVIQYSFSSVDSDGDQLTGTYVWKVDNAVIQGATGECIIGVNTFDITNYLTYNNRRFTLVITDSAGSTKTKHWTARKVDIKIESSFNDKNTKPTGQPIVFNYTPYGASIEKTVHFRLDGVELPSVTTPLSAIAQEYSIPAQEHGAHLLECWITATVGNAEIETNHIYKDIICVDESSSVPIISSVHRCLQVGASAVFDADTKYYMLNESGTFVVWGGNADSWPMRPTLYYGSVVADQYDNTTLTYMIYKPGGGIAQVEINTDGVVRTETTDTLVNTLSYQTAVDGVHTITLSTGTEPNDCSITIIMDIAKLDIDIAPVTTGLAMDFNPSGYSNGSIDKNAPWTYEKDSSITLTVSDGFDWSNGGFQLDENGNSYFCVKAGHRAYLSYKPFGKDIKPNGSHFKMIFKTQNVRDIDATFLSCLSDNVGLTMNVHSVDLKTSAGVLNAPYSEEDIIEFEYNIEPLDTTQSGAKALVMIYEDGTPYRPMEYDDNHRVYQNTNPVGITIGSDDCDVLIYRMTANAASLTDKNVISNFIADALGAEEILDRYYRNQIYDASTGMLTPESLAAACPWLKVIKIECPRFTNNKSDKVPNTNIQCIHKGGDPILDNWYATGAQHSGQGTTSNEYGVASRNMDLIMNKGAVITTGVSDVINGIPTTIEGSEVVEKVSLTRTSIPNNYFNIKVNVASSENANNALSQRRYDRYLPYTPVSKKKDPYTKTTMEFVNCVVFVRETGVGTDSEGNTYTRQEFQDDQWHYYSLGNIGDSKKTDGSRACDSNDINEFTNEVLDNTFPNSVFDTGVTNLLYETLPAQGELLSDYYVQNEDGTFTHSRYINNNWVTVSTSVAEISNGATAIFSTLPITGMKRIDYYVGTEGSYKLYTWDGVVFSEGVDKTKVEKTHMATAIAPEQWVAGNVKYDALMADKFDKKGTYELRYCVDEDNITPHIKIWQDMYKFVITSTDEEFVNGIGNWFIEDALTYFYLFTERYTMTDNRSKNSFYHWSKVYISEEEAASTYVDVAQYYTIDNDKAAINNGYRFDFWHYDGDTQLGINNSGEMKMPYGMEDIDYFDDDVTKGYVFNGAENALFRRVRLLMHDQLRAMYQSRESAGCWDSESMITEYDNFQAQFPEELWRLDVERKYMRPYLGTSVDNSIPKTSDRFLKTMLNGRKKYQRRQFERDQAAYMGTKYLATSVTDDQIMFRCNTPAGVAVSPDYTLNIVPYSDMYLSVAFGNNTGSSTSQIRAKAGQNYEVKCPYDGMTDTAVLVYSASRIQELNDLSKCYIHDNDFSKAVKLQKLIIGNSTPGYANAFLERLTIGNNRLLSDLNIRNCPNLTGSLDMSLLGSLVTFDARGTKINAVTFAENGKLVTAYLPDGITALTMKNLDYVETFDASYDDIERITINGGNLDTVAIGTDVSDTATDIHFGDVDWTLSDTTVLQLLYKITNCYISGNIVITGSIGDYEYKNYQAKWPDVIFDVSGATVVSYYEVRFMDDDGTVLDSQYVVQGGKAVDPITRDINPIATPTKESTAEFTFEYAGWDRNPANVVISKNTDFTVTYTETVRTYTVRWYNGNALLQTKTVAYGASCEYEGEDPTDTSLEVNLIYRLFDGWDNSAGFVDKDIDIHAKFTQATAPTPEDGKELADMTPTELYALVRKGTLSSTGENNDVIASGDEFDLVMGTDFDFDNVESQEIIPLSNPMTFDGKTCFDTGIKLFENDHPFTLAIDMAYVTSTANQFIASCYDSSGFRVVTNTSGNSELKWGASATTSIAPTLSREIVIIQRKYKDNNLYVYSAAASSDSIKEVKLVNSLSTKHSAPLTFGANKQSDGYVDPNTYANGIVYWAKLWHTDLGSQNCRELASWTRETLTMQAAGTTERAFRLFRITEGGQYANCCFIMKDLLDRTAIMNITGSNVGGWADTALRTWLNNRIYNGLPKQWRYIVQKVNVSSSVGGGTSQEITTSEDYIWIPSCKELGLNVNTSPYSGESDGTINFFTDNTSRIKHLGDTDEAYAYWTRSPVIGYDLYFYNVTADGSGSYGYPTSDLGVCFGICI